MGDVSEIKDADGTALPAEVLDSLAEGCQVISPDFRYLYVNGAVARHGKTTREALRGRRMEDCYPGIEATPMFAVLRRCMTARTVETLENEFTFPDGSTGWFELRFEPVPAGVAILSVDVTERKRAEQASARLTRALRTLSRCNQTLVRASDEPAFISDICALLVESGGYPAAWMALVDAGDPSRLEPIGEGAGGGASGVRAAALAAAHARVGGPVERCLGTRRPAYVVFDKASTHDAAWAQPARAMGLGSCVALPIKGQGRPSGVLCLYADRSDEFDDDERALLEEVALDLGFGLETIRARAAQQQTASALEVAELRAQAVFERMPAPALLWQRRASGFTLVAHNEAAVEATSGAVAVLVGGPPPGDVPGLLDDLEACARTRAVVHREVKAPVPGGSDARHLLLTYAHVPPDVVLQRAEDVTERRHLEEQLQAAVRLEAVGKLAGGVAHDFNNLLSVILSYTEFGLRSLADGAPLKEELEQVHEAGLKAAELVRQLLAFSRKQILEPKVTNLNRVVQAVESLLRRLLGEDIDITVHPDKDLGNALVDPGQIEQVVMNLAVNARDAMPRGGKLTIETANVELDEAYASAHVGVKPGPFVRLTVTDTGEGMSAATLNRIFEPFFTTKEVGKGTGLGLSTVYGIVKQSGGHIWVYSEPGRGASFKVYFPRVEAEAEAGPRRAAEVAVKGTGTILLVEDDDAVRGVGERMLQLAGYTVLPAANAREALELLEARGGEVALVLTDVVMPGMSGGELAKRVKARWPKVKVLLTSGYTDNAIVHHGALDPGTHFISKPFGIGSLTKKVREVLDEA